MPKERTSAQVMWRMLGLVRPLAGWMVLAIACGVLGFVCATAIPVLATQAALNLAAHGSVSVVVYGVPLVALAVARGVLHYVEQRTNHYIAFRLLAHIRSLVFGSLRRLAPAKLAGADRGSLISTLTADVELLEVFYAHTISPIAIALIMSCLMVAFIGSAHPALGAVAAAAYVVVGIAVPLVSARLTAGVGRSVRERAAGLSGYVLDGLRGLGEVLQFDAGERYLSEMDGRSRELVDDQHRIASVSGMAGAVVGALITCFSLAVLALGMRLQAAGEAEAYDVVVATVALMSSFGPVVALANLGTGLQATLASGARVLDILEEEPQVNEVAEGATPAFSGVRAEDVRFSYAGANGTREQVLDGVSLTVPKGSIVGISGKSGSGKSTLLRLLMRFWDVDAGEVRVSGEPIAGIATSHLRSLEALVEQDTYLFHDSIRDNLLVAKPDATQEELEAACRAASVHDFIEALPQGYDSMVGELGDTLSGGERQRLGLARAFLHDAPFLLLDEPTSNLDSINEGIILKSLAAQRGERTVLLVSHRASTMGIADESYAMDEGRVS